MKETGDTVAISRRDLDELVERVVVAVRAAKEAALGVLFAMRFDLAVRAGNICESERPLWRDAFLRDSTAVDDLLGHRWRWAP